MTPAAEAHIEAQRRLRLLVATAVAAIWRDIRGYDEENVDEFVTTAVPTVLAAQRAAVALTEQFIAASLERQPLGVIPDDLIGAAVRAGVGPEFVYRRPFVTTWSALGKSKPWQDAVSAGEARAKSTAAMDVQMSMRATLRAVGEADDLILGYQRVPDADACPFCKLVAGQRYTTDQLMPIHNHCGCGVDIITAANRGDFTGKRANDLSVPGVAVHEHGELGPVLGDPAHDFTAESDLLAA